MSEVYVYDIEVFPNIFMLTAINANTNPKVIDAYEKACIINDTTVMRRLEEAMGVRTFVVASEYRNDLPLLLSFMKRHKTVIGYNNHNYDNLILDYIMMYGQRYNNHLRNAKNQSFNDVIFRLSSNIISYGKGYDRIFREEYDMQYYKRLYYTYDIQRVLYLDKRYVSLKQVAIMLKWYLIQDLPYDPHETINLNDEVVEKLRFYNINDCVITKKVIDVSIEEINLRAKVSELYSINVRNESRSGIANRYFIKVYSDLADMAQSALSKLRTYRHTISIKDIISPVISFNSDRLKDMLWSLNQTKIRVGSQDKDSKFEIDVSFHGKLYQFRKGGLHSKDAPGHFTADDEYIYMDADVTSFYPFIMILLQIYPEHLDRDIFLQVIQDIVNNRVSAKELVKKIKAAIKSDKAFTKDELILLEKALETATTKAEALKIVINAIYGKMGDEHSPLYDLKAMYKTTINGQLFLLMLIEKLAEKGFQNISANTDGVITKVKRSRLDEFYQACKEWEDITGFTLEYTPYEKYICSDVNNYIAIKEGFKDSTESNELKVKNYVKKKGSFVTEIQLDKGYFAPIVSMALEQYFCFNVPIKDTLFNDRDIYNFCISKKTNDDFITVFSTVDSDTKKYVEQLLQKNNRFYISEVSTGGLTKKYKKSKPNKKGVVVKEISMVAKKNITVFNKYYPVDDFSEYAINYRFYNNEVMKILIPIEMSTQTLF